MFGNETYFIVGWADKPSKCTRSKNIGLCWVGQPILQCLVIINKCDNLRNYLLTMIKMIASSSCQALRVKAHTLKPVVLLGSKGLTPAVLQEIDIALTAHELIKVKLAGQAREEREQMKTQICSSVKAECIQAIGMILVLYRKNPNK